MGDTLGYVALQLNEGVWSTSTLLNLNDEESLYLEAGSFKVVAPAKQSVLAQTNRRWGGVRQVGETTENGMVEWKAGVFGGSASEALQKVESILAQIEANPWSLLLEWKPAGASEPSLFEVRETGNWTPEYDERAFTGAGLFVFQVQIPVAPLAQGLPVVVYSKTELTLPEVLELDAIPGDAPAQAEVSIQAGSSVDPASAPAVWAMLGWASRPVTPTPRTVKQKEEAHAPDSGWDKAPFGIIEAQDYTDYDGLVSGWAKASNSEARGGEYLYEASAAHGTLYSAAYKINPACLVPDSFSGEIAVELWARVYLADTLTIPTVVPSFFSGANANVIYGAQRWTDEWGKRGRTFIVPAESSRFRFSRLGTMHMVVEPLRVQPWTLNLDFEVGSESSGAIGLDYLILVPVMQRACSPTGKELEPATNSYPRFLSRVSTEQVKTIRSDLSGWVTFEGGGGYPDTGLSGQMIELPPGETDLLVKLASLVPDDPSRTGAAAESQEALSFQDASVEVTVTPRWFLNPS